MSDSDRKYDVGIYGLWYGRNYGSIITYYSLNTVINEAGFTTVMLSNPLGNESIDIDSLVPSHPLRFAAKHYNVSPKYDINSMNKFNDLCHTFVVGSDQMWNYGLSRPYQQTYFLDFVSEENRKISYATSFGKYPYNGPESEIKKIKQNMAKFNAVSVRDDFSKKIVEETIGLEATMVIDPVFLCPIQKYMELIEEKNIPQREDYIFAYILDPNEEWGRQLVKIADISGKNILVAFNESGDKENFYSRLGIDDYRISYLPDPTVNEWLSLFLNADFVLTDSFHGICFSTIFHKQYIVLKNVSRGGLRFDCLMNTIKLHNRMVDSLHKISDKYIELQGNDIDYDIVENYLKIARSNGRKWLSEALHKSTEEKVNKITFNDITHSLSQDMCMGCSACVNSCPTDALSLQPDQWGYYRSTLDYEKCVKCGNCINVCPAYSKKDNGNNASPECYEFVAADDDVLLRSSSGGIFPAMANIVLSQGGVVAGAAWNDDFTVEHVIIDTADDLGKLQKSKYLQSYMGDCYKQVKKHLESGQKVLFTGTPCQVYGLRSFLGKSYDNLIAVDMFCGNAPSAGFFKKYIEDSFGSSVRKYGFRYKSETTRWDCIHIFAEQYDGTVITRSGPKEDNYQRVFHNHTMCAKHCEKCQYQSFARVGDLTMGDFWGIGKRDPELDTFKGVSLVLINNEKGKSFFDSIPDEVCRVRKKVPLEWMGGNGYSRNGGHNYCSPQRDAFYKSILTKPFGEAVNYALKPNHGQFRKAYENTNTFLQFDSVMQHFRFESSVWEEISVSGRTTLIVKDNKWKENGHYARMNLAGMLKKGASYRISVKFKINSNSNILNFHVIDSGSRQLQVIHTEHIEGRNNGNEWIEFSDTFIPDTDYYDQIMFGAAQVSGVNNYLTIAYINIAEER